MSTENEWWAERNAHAELGEVGAMLSEVFGWDVEDALRFLEKPWKWNAERAKWIALGRPDPTTLEMDDIIDDGPHVVVDGGAR